MSDLKFTAQPRTLVGRRVRQLRRQGLVPATLYGKTLAAQNLQFAERTFERVIQAAGFSQLVQVDVEGGSTHNVLIRAVHRHPVTHSFMHVDLYAVDLTVKQQVQVPVHSTGKPEALVTGLMVLQSLEHINLEALPRAIPTHLDIDITHLTPENPITIAQLPVIDGVEYLNEPEEAIFMMIVTRAEAETEAETTEAEPALVRPDRDDE
jgi:large subunit ribosomal protein L25